MGNETRDNCYVLQLNSRLGWNLSGDEGARSWLNRFAQILQLKPGIKSGLPKIVFVRTGGDWFEEPEITADLTKEFALSKQRRSPRDLFVLRLWSGNDDGDLLCELLNTQANDLEIMMMSQSLYPLYSEAIRLGGLPAHAALLELNGQAVLLAGTSGSGKSTCCRRVPPHWKVLSEDEALVLEPHSGIRRAHPLPTWKDCQIKESPNSCDVTQAPQLKAIFFLAGWNTDRVSETGRGEAAVRISHSADQSCSMLLQYLDDAEQEEWRRRMFQNACSLAEEIPAYSLQVSATGRFWEHMEAVLADLPPTR
jgi:SynChlorMet cassette protein ScmC